MIKGLRLRNVRDGGSRSVDCSALFVFIGAQPRTDWLPERMPLDPTLQSLREPTPRTPAAGPHGPYGVCTVENHMAPWVFAAGDVRSGRPTRWRRRRRRRGALAVTRGPDPLVALIAS